MAVRTFAAIDVGSYELAMKIFEISPKGGIRLVDHIRHRLDLGSDTYHTGKISGDKMDELCRILGEYSKIMQGYKVDDYKAYGTSAIRETSNTLIVREQVKLRTGIDLDVLTNSEQRFLHCKAAASKGTIFNDFIKKGTAIADIGGGSIQISLFDNEKLQTTQNISLGVLRIQDMLKKLQPRTKDYNEVLEELIDNQLFFFKKQHLKNKEIENIILIDDYISLAMEHVYPDTRMVSAKVFKEAFRKVICMSMEEISKRYEIPEETAELMIPAMTLVSRIIKITKAEMIWCPGVDLSDGMAYEYAENEKLIPETHDFENDIIASAVYIAKRYNANRERNQLVEAVAMDIFDATRKLHHLGKREKLLLRIAAIMGDCGRYMSLEKSAECGYQIIMANEMIGISHVEREMVANIVRFNKMHFEYYEGNTEYHKPDRESYLIIAKLSALFRVADGLCRSYRPKINGAKPVLKDNELVITVDSNESIALEVGYFARKSNLFEEIFAVRCRIKYRKKSVASKL